MIVKTSSINRKQLYSGPRKLPGPITRHTGNINKTLIANYHLSPGAGRMWRQEGGGSGLTLGSCCGESCAGEWCHAQIENN